MGDYTTFKDLTVWQKAMDLCDEVYVLSKLLPKEETYALAQQMRRAAVSVPSNIAEGYKRNTNKDFIQFLSVSSGSNAEVETQIYIAVRQNLISEEQAKRALSICTEVSKMLNALINRLKADS